jgi:DNA-directed RNA polymerase specialized sigma24 family protein
MAAPPDPAAAPPRAVVDAALRKVAWASVYPRVLAFAIARTKSKARAEDLTQDAIRAVYDHELRAWNPVAAPDILPVLLGIVRRNLSNERASGRVHHEITVMSKSHDVRVTRAVSQIASSIPTPESALATHDLLARRIAALRARAAADPLVLSLLSLTEDGVDTAADQAASLSAPIEDIRRARRRLFDHVAAVARALPDEDDAPDSDDEVAQ